ncbi:hypothetical protein [Azotobacter vinelandii]
MTGMKADGPMRSALSAQPLSVQDMDGQGENLSSGRRDGEGFVELPHHAQTNWQHGLDWLPGEVVDGCKALIVAGVVDHWIYKDIAPPGPGDQCFHLRERIELRDDAIAIGVGVKSVGKSDRSLQHSTNPVRLGLCWYIWRPATTARQRFSRSYDANTYGFSIIGLI